MTPNLSTRYLGLALENPVVASAMPMTFTVDGVRALQDAGVGAIVMRSIFEEQIREDGSAMEDDLSADLSPHAMAYLKADFAMQFNTARYLEQVRTLRASCKVPLIASLNCCRPDTWLTFAKEVENTGVDAIELNIYDISCTPSETAAKIEDRHIELVRSVLKHVSIPVAVKIAPYYTSVLNFARRLDQLGVAGLVLFNRFFQPDIDVEKMALVNTINTSRSESLRIPLRWTALLRPFVKCDIGLTGGVHAANDAVRGLLAGATTLCMASEIIQRGASVVIPEVLDGLRDWMTRHRFSSLGDFRGRLAERNMRDNVGFERVQYINTFTAF